jgi:hypothetical protein
MLDWYAAVVGTLVMIGTALAAAAVGSVVTMMKRNETSEEDRPGPLGP